MRRRRGLRLIGDASPTITAAAATLAVAPARGHGSTPFPGWGFGPALEPFTVPPEAAYWWDRSAAMSLPTISRCRDLIVSAVAALPFTFWSIDRTAVPEVATQIIAPTWADRPDPDRTRQWVLAWTVDDLMFYERAYWLVTRRGADSFPSAFRRLEPGTVHVGTDGTVTVDGNGTTDPRDLVVFESPLEGLLSNGYRAISIALQLDGAADRFAANEIPAGVLEEQDGGEDMSAEDLTDLAESFTAARSVNAVAALNKYIRYREIPVNANDLQLVEGRTYQALELARLGNVPPYLVGAPAGTGMTYLNGQQAKADLIDFGAAPLIGCIEQTLSGPNVTPRGQAVRLDQDAWLRNPFTTVEAPAPPTAEAVPTAS